MTMLHLLLLLLALGSWPLMQQVRASLPRPVAQGVHIIGACAAHAALLPPYATGTTSFWVMRSYTSRTCAGGHRRGLGRGGGGEQDTRMSMGTTY